MNILEILGKIGFDWQVALANLVNFLIIFAIVYYFAFKPIRNVIRKRQNKIKEGLDNAEKAETDLRQAEEKKEQILMEARQEANEIVADAKERADKTAKQIIHEAEERKERIIRDGEKKAQKAYERMEGELKSQASKLAVSSVEKILNEEMTEKRHKQLSEKAVDMMRK